MLVKELTKTIHLGNNRESVSTFLSLSHLSLRLLSWEERGKWCKHKCWLRGPFATADPSEQQEGIGHAQLWIILCPWWKWCAINSLYINMTSQCVVCYSDFFQYRQTISSFVLCKTYVSSLSSQHNKSVCCIVLKTEFFTTGKHIPGNFTLERY